MEIYLPSLFKKQYNDMISSLGLEDEDPLIDIWAHQTLTKCTAYLKYLVNQTHCTYNGKVDISYGVWGYT